MKKIKASFEYNEYNLKAIGVVNTSGHIVGLKISSNNKLKLDNLDEFTQTSIKELAEDLIMEEFYCPEMEF